MEKTATKEQSEAFKEYMMNALRESMDYRARLEQRNQQAINFFLIIFTAIIGGVILIIINLKQQPIVPLILGLISFSLALYGLLTYVWMKKSISDGMRVEIYQLFFHKYFQDMNPPAFEKYGLKKIYHLFYSSR